MKTETDELPEHEAVAAIRKHAAWLVRDAVLSPEASSDLQRALEHAVTQGREDRLAVVALVDGLLHALAHGLLAPAVFVVDGDRQVTRFHLKPTLDTLVAAKLLTPEARARLRQRLPSFAEWLPAAGLRAVQRRSSFGGRQHRGFELDLAKAQAFLKRTEAVPVR
jgi:hypothetical protein